MGISGIYTHFTWLRKYVCTNKPSKVSTVYIYSLYPQRSAAVVRYCCFTYNDLLYLHTYNGSAAYCFTCRPL